jgi:hypothetical protein
MSTAGDHIDSHAFSALERDQSLRCVEDTAGLGITQPRFTLHLLHSQSSMSQPLHEAVGVQDIPGETMDIRMLSPTPF